VNCGSAGGSVAKGMKKISYRGYLGMGKGHLTSLVRLSYLGPDIARALLKGRQPIELTPTRLLRLSKDLPHDWSEQGQFLGFAGDHP
jgi:hypothetical protein